MPTIKEFKEIVKVTPIEQAIMVEGPHGIGKSEILKQIYLGMGYKVIILFLGQMADAGDIIGLPDRKTITVDGKKISITEFCPPKWWPLSKNEKVCIILDEANRGKPEINQCVMDMVLNHRLNGRDLPKDTRIIAAVNPLKEGYYQVEELDPAYLDRFNKYEFAPSVDEWIDWGTGKIHNTILGFISKRSDLLDPPKDVKDYKPGTVYPSRRSWERVSNIIKNNETLITTPEGLKLLSTILIGMVGNSTSSAYTKFIRTEGTGLTAGKILTGWDKDVESKILAMNVQDYIITNKQISIYLDENINDILNNKARSVTIAKNVQLYLEAIKPEAVAEFFNLIDIANNEKKEWPKSLFKINPQVGLRFVDMMTGQN